MKIRKQSVHLGKKVIRRFAGITVGMRTVKSAFAVLVCILFYYLIAHLGFTTNFDIFLACTAAIISMQDSVKNSVKIGAGRLQGTVVGALLGMGVLYLDIAIRNEAAHVALIVLGVVLLIVICNLLNINNAIVMGCVLFFFITLQAADADPFLMSVQRFIDTAVGIGISVAINHLIRNPDKNGCERETDDDDVESPDERPPE